MNFRQVQLLEYSFFCLKQTLESKLSEEDMPNFKLVIQSSNDIFVADSLQFDQYRKPYFSLPRDTESFFYDKTPIAYRYLENDHPFLKVRNIIYKKFEHFYSVEDSIIVNEPSLLIMQIWNLIKDIDSEFEANQSWCNYKSKVSSLEMEFNLDTDDEYKVISLG